MEVAVGDLDPQADGISLRARSDLDLFHLEAEVVEPVDALGDQVVLVRRDGVLQGDLTPERPVATLDVLTQPQVRRLDVEALGRGDVGHLAADVLHHDLQVVPALAVEQLRAQLGGLGVDEQGLDGAGVVPVQHVAERAVAPEAAQQVELDQEEGEGVQQLLAARPEPTAGEQLAVGEGVVGVAGEKHGGALGAGVDGSANHEADRTDGRPTQLLQTPERAVVALGRPGRELLQRERRALQRQEPHLVA